MQSDDMFFTAANFNSKQCLAIPFSYEKGKISRFMLAYCLYKTAYDINPKIIDWFTDVYDDCLDFIFYKGEFTDLPENKGNNVYNIPFGYDGTKMHMSFTNVFWCIYSQSYDFKHDSPMEIPFYAVDGKFSINYTEMFNTDTFNEHIIMTLMKKMLAEECEMDDFKRRYNNVKEHLMPFEDGLTFYVFGYKIQYGYIRTLDELFEKIPHWKEREEIRND